MSKQLAAPQRAGVVPRKWGRIMDAAIAGQRTPITKQGRLVAAVVSAADLELLERTKRAAPESA